MKVYVVTRVFNPCKDITELIGVYTSEAEAREAQENAWDFNGGYRLIDVVFDEVIIDED